MQREITREELEAYKNPSDPSRTIISADYTTNRIMGKNEAILHLETNRLEHNRKTEVKEELTTFLNNGGEGLDLSFDEACMIYAIAYIFTKYEYPPYIECTENQLFKAMQYDKNICGWQRQRLRKILTGLSKKRFPIYWLEEPKWKWLTFDTLIKLAWGIKTKNGNVEFIEVPTADNFDLYRIWLSDLLFGRLRRNFRLADPCIGKKIREYRKRQGKKPTKYDIRLYELLLHENKQMIKRNYLKIAQGPMLMDKYISQRKYKLIRQRLNSIYQMYCELGYLSNYKINQPGARYPVDILHLNPDMFYKFRNGYRKNARK